MNSGHLNIAFDTLLSPVPNMQPIQVLLCLFLGVYHIHLHLTSSTATIVILTNNSSY